MDGETRWESKTEEEKGKEAAGSERDKCFVMCILSCLCLKGCLTADVGVVTSTEQIYQGQQFHRSLNLIHFIPIILKPCSFTVCSAFYKQACHKVTLQKSNPVRELASQKWQWSYGHVACNLFLRLWLYWIITALNVILDVRYKNIVSQYMAYVFNICSNSW